MRHFFCGKMFAEKVGSKKKIIDFLLVHKLELKRRFYYERMLLGLTDE